MKLSESGQLIFEEVECWMCNGTGKNKNYILCPNYGKPVKGINKRTGMRRAGTCEHCGTTNKNDHKTIGEKFVDCFRCKAGRHTETEMDNLPYEIYASFPMKFTRNPRESNFNESYLGIGVVGGWTDYGRSNNLSDEELGEELQKSYKTFGRQAINFIRKGNLCKELLVIRVLDGVSVYPVW